MEKVRKLLCSKRFTSEEQQLTTATRTLSVDTAHNLTIIQQHPQIQLQYAAPSRSTAQSSHANRILVG